MSSLVSFLPGGLLVPALAAFGSILYAISRWRKGAESNQVRLATGINRDRQAIEMEDEPGVYRSGLLVDQKEPMSKFYEEVDTLYTAFLRGLEVSSNGDCLGYRPGAKQNYHFISYTDVFRAARDFGSALTGQFGVKY
uniref:Uncharacterized protein n=1 Tax=Plectus sambesii TaxID=2011161 RepID=A0A914W3R7_9BILA